MLEYDTDFISFIVRFSSPETWTENNYEYKFLTSTMCLDIAVTEWVVENESQHIVMCDIVFSCLKWAVIGVEVYCKHICLWICFKFFVQDISLNL